MKINDRRKEVLTKLIKKSDMRKFNPSDILIMKGVLRELNQPKIEVFGKRWFQKMYGNTYHSVKVYVDDQLFVETSFEYGYGDQYRQTAIDLLIANKFFKEDVSKLASYEMREKYNIKYSVEDVKRKKEL